MATKSARKASTKITISVRCLKCFKIKLKKKDKYTRKYHSWRVGQVMGWSQRGRGGFPLSCPSLSMLRKHNLSLFLLPQALSLSSSWLHRKTLRNLSYYDISILEKITHVQKCIIHIYDHLCTEIITSYIYISCISLSFPTDITGLATAACHYTLDQ